MRWHGRTSRRGRASVNNTCATDGGKTQTARVPLIAFQIIAAAVDPGRDNRQLPSESNEVGASTRS
jgi:hypothetical protein